MRHSAVPATLMEVESANSQPFVARKSLGRVGLDPIHCDHLAPPLHSRVYAPDFSDSRSILRDVVKFVKTI